MHRKYLVLAIIVLLPVLWSCEESGSSSSPDLSDNPPEWLIPTNEIFDGGPGKDGIPALTTPEMTSAGAISYLNDNDLVIATKLDGEVRIYPHKILDWHEIINDAINDNRFAITYCPLTGSGISYDRVLKGKVTTFGVSGLLYNTNLIPYDRATNSNWSQMKMMSVNGELIGETADTFPIVETTWGKLKNFYNDAKVVTTNTGHSRNYNRFPYGDYKTNHNFLLFPVSHKDDRLPKKERVLGIFHNGVAKAYRFSADNLTLIESNVGGTNIVVAVSKNDNLIVAYQPELVNGEKVSLSVEDNNLPVIMKDDNNNEYDLFGTVISGPSEGERLKPVTQFIAYWFAWAAFYPETDLQ